MVAVRLYFAGERVGPQFKRGALRQSARVRLATRQAVQETAREILVDGRSDIAAGGNFGSARWQEGLKAKVSEGGGNIRLSVTHDVPYFMVFQRGALIRGKPLLWIPLSFAADAQGVRARDYPGRLFRVNRLSGAAPLLLSAADKQPKYFGKPSVRIPKKFHLLEIIALHARNMENLYRRYFREDKGR